VHFKLFIETQLTLGFDNPVKPPQKYSQPPTRPILSSVSRYEGFNVLRINIDGKTYEYMIDPGVECEKIIKQFNIPGAGFRALNSLKRIANVI